MIEVRGLSKRYGDLVALADVSMQVAAGELVVVLGPSGAGKSTLLRCINRLVQPSAGEVRIGGEVLPASRSGLRRVRSQVGMIFQDHNLVPRLSVLKNVLAGRLARMPEWMSLLQIFRDEDVRIALESLKRVELEERAWSRADRLSGGQQQRVGIARALMQQPRMILADEPVASLDPVLSHSILQYLEQLNKEGITVLCSLHFLDLVHRYATRAIALKDGEVVFQGLPKQIDDAQFKAIYGQEAERVSIV